MTEREEAKFILDTLQQNTMPEAAREWLRKRFWKLLLNSTLKPIP